MYLIAGPFFTKQHHTLLSQSVTTNYHNWICISSTCIIVVKLPGIPGQLIKPGSTGPLTHVSRFFIGLFDLLYIRLYHFYKASKLKSSL